MIIKYFIFLPIKTYQVMQSMRGFAKWCMRRSETTNDNCLCKLIQSSSLKQNKYQNNKVWFHNLCCCFRLNRVLNKSHNFRTYEFFELRQPSKWGSQGQTVSKYPVYYYQSFIVIYIFMLIAVIFFLSPVNFSILRKLKIFWIGVEEH